MSRIKTILLNATATLSLIGAGTATASDHNSIRPVSRPHAPAASPAPPHVAPGVALPRDPRSGAPFGNPIPPAANPLNSPMPRPNPLIPNLPVGRLAGPIGPLTPLNPTPPAVTAPLIALPATITIGTVPPAVTAPLIALPATITIGTVPQSLPTPTGHQIIPPLPGEVPPGGGVVTVRPVRPLPVRPDRPIISSPGGITIGGGGGSAPADSGSSSSPASGGESTPQSSSAPSIATEMPTTQPAAATQPAIDVEFVDAQFVDGGDAEKKLGPCYRIRVINNSAVGIAQPFDVTLVASGARKITANAQQATARIKGMKAGEVVSLDIRLPVEALNMGINSEKQPVPFSWLIAVVDSREELQETKVDNNFAILARLDIPVVEVGK